MLGEEVGLEGLERLGWIADGDRSPRVPAGRDLGEDPSGAVAQLESTQYLRNQLLRDSDWASMAHSLELRTPFVDLQLARELAPYTNRFRKGQGKKLLGESAPNPMPEAVMQRPKTGFSIPMQAWMRRADLVGRSNTEHWSRGWARTLLALNA
jgi:asparagine synthase (glutamine-hydrolysing)